MNYTYNAELKVVSCLLQKQVILWQQQMLNLVSLRFSPWNLLPNSCRHNFQSSSLEFLEISLDSSKQLIETDREAGGARVTNAHSKMH